MDSTPPEESQRAFVDHGVVFPLRILSTGDASELYAKILAFRASRKEAHQDNRQALSYYPWEPQEYALLAPLQELVRSAPVQQAIKPILGEAFYLRNCDIFFKESLARSGEGQVIPSPKQHVVWHVDEPHSSLAGGMMTLWIALTDVQEDSGPLTYLKGSHRAPTTPPIQDRNALTISPRQWEDVRHLPRLKALLRPGEAVAHHSNIIHSSKSTQESGPRVGLALRFLGPNITPEIAGCGAVAQATENTPEKSRFKIQQDFTINWWSPGS